MIVQTKVNGSVQRQATGIYLSSAGSGSQQDTDAKAIEELLAFSGQDVREGSAFGECG